jgi:hypothetical protein
MNIPQKTLSLLAVASLFAFSSLSAVTTDPVGYVTLTVNGSTDGSVAYTPLSVSLEKPVQASGALSEAPTSAVATDSLASYTPSEFAGTDAAGNATHYLQFTGSGLIVDITANTATTITVDTDLSGVVDTSAGYVVKKYMTIADLFGADNSAGLSSGGDSASSDLIYVMSSDGAGQYQIYYYQTDSLGFLGGNGWRLNGDSFTDASNVTIMPDQGIIIGRAVAGDLSVVVSGSVNVVDHNRGLPNGFSLVSYPYPVDVTLADSGIYSASNGYQSGGDSASSDLVYVLGSDGTFSTFYYQTDSLGFLGGNGWRSGTDTFTDVGSYSIPAGSSIIIKHTGSGLLWADAKPF